MMAVGLTIVLGVMNIPNFAHGELYMVGAYAAFFTYSAGLHPLLAILSGGLASFVVGIFIDRSIFYPLRSRFKEQWVKKTFLITVALSLALTNIVQIIWQARRRGIVHYWGSSIQLTPDLTVSMDRFVSFLIAIFLIVALWFFLNRTQTGRAIRAASQDEMGAMMVGIDLDKIHALTFGLSSMLAGVAGASLLSIIPAYPTAGVRPLKASWFVVILVGMGNVGGSIIGGFIMGMVEAFSYHFVGEGWQDVISLSILILILLFKPAGLFGTQVSR